MPDLRSSLPYFYQISDDDFTWINRPLPLDFNGSDQLILAGSSVDQPVRQEHRYPMDNPSAATISKYKPSINIAQLSKCPHFQTPRIIHDLHDMLHESTLKRRNPKIFFELLSGQAPIQSNHVPISRNCA